MRRFYFLALLALLASVVAHAATISQTPKPTSPLRATDKIPLGREGDSTAYAASVDQIMKYVYANYTGGGSRGPAGPQGPIGPQGPAGSPATNIITSVQGKTGVVVLTPSDIGAAPVTAGVSILKGNGSGGTTAATPGTDYLAPNGSAAGLNNFPLLNQDTTGTAGALATNGSNCGAGQAAAGVDAAGNAEGCFTVTPANIGAITLTVFTNYTSFDRPTRSEVAAAAQGAKADTALQPGDVDNEVYAKAYNGGVLNSTTINAALTAIGSTVKTLVLTPGDWAMDSSVTTPATCILRVQPGARIVQTAGTLSINGPLEAPQRQWLVGFTSNELNIGPKVSTVYMDWMDATGDGVTEDFNPFCALVRSGSNLDIHLNGTKKYHIGAACQTRQDGVRIWAHNATIVSEIEGDVLTFGGWKSTTTGQAITFTKDARTFTIPGGISIAVGDMVQAWDTTPYNTSGSNYYYGILTEVTAISGSTATISIPAAYTFTADTIGVVYPAKGVEIHDLVADNSASINATRGVVVSAKDFVVDNVTALGSTNASAGLIVEGIRGKVSRVSSRGYIGQAASCLSGAGGRPCGYGITINGHQITVDGDSTFADSKHTISMCKGTYWSSGLAILNSHLSQNPALFGTDGAGASGNLYQMALDMHNNCSDISVIGNTIIAAGQNGAVGVRNAGNGVKLYGNTIRYKNNSGTKYSIIGVGDADLASLQMSDNTIFAEAAGTPLVAAYDGVHTGSDSVVKLANNVMTNITYSSPFACTGTDKVSGYNAATGTYTCTADQTSTGTTLTIREEDGTPSGTPSTLKVTNGTLTDNGDGSYSLNTGGTNGASTASAFVTIGTDAALSGERSLVGTTNRITVTDGGANGNVTLSTPQDLHTSATPQFAKLGIGRSAVENGLTIGGYTATSIRQMLTGSTTNSFYMNNDSDVSGTIKKYTDTGNSLLEISPIPNDTTQLATLRFLRSTNTSGLASVDIYKANNTTTVNHRLAGNANSFLGGDNGNVGIGATTTPAEKLHVFGNEIVTGNLTAKTLTGTIPAATTYAATTTIDLSLGDSPSVTLTGNPILAFSNPVAGQWHTLELIQDATGGRTVTWPSTGLVCTWRNADGTTTAPTQVTTANSHAFYLIHTKSTTAADCFAR